MHEVISYITKFFSHPLRLVYPVFCRGCNIHLFADTTFCESCTNKIQPLVSMRLVKSKKISLTVFAVGKYQSPLRELILRKLSGDQLASRQLGHLLAMHTPAARLGIDYLVPVPIHWLRYARRGYNQAEVMARTVSKDLDGIPVKNLVTRVRATAFQSTLPAEFRSKNLDHAFKLATLSEDQKKIFAGKHLCIVDDLCTTGTTLIGVATALAALRPAEISAIVVARSL